MRRCVRPIALIFAAAVAACGSRTPPPPDTSGSVETVRGTERLGWDQRAGDTVELGSFRYAIYVDGNRSEIADVSCGGAAGANGFGCSGRLPSMAIGSHTLELATFIVEGGNIVESARSSPLRVNVTASLTGAATRIVAGQSQTTQDGVRLRVAMAIEDGDDIVDIAFDPGGRLFIAERVGRVRVIDQSGRSTATTIEGVATDGDAGMLGLALSPAFDETHHVFVAHTIAGEHSPTELRVARYREVNGTLGERAVLLDRVPMRAGRPASVVAFGPDARLYVAIDDGGDARRSGDAASLNGKILRLNADGTTPDDQTGAIYLAGYRSPRGLAWSASGTLWTVDGDPQSPERLVAGALISQRPRRASAATPYALDRGTHPSDAAACDGQLIAAFKGNLLIAAEAGYILRVRLDPYDPTRILATERLLEGTAPVRAIAISPAGEIYFATAGAVAKLIANR
jgi:glucose/arabinose dehydrogenase